MELEDQIKIKALNQFIIQRLHIPAEENELKSISYLVLNHLFQLYHTDFILNKKIIITPAKRAELEAIIKKINNQEPVQYALGRTEFYGLGLKVGPEVLIPRPETEELVDWVIKENSRENLKVLDIGTGSGCIAISLKKNLKNAAVHALDISEKALEIAIENAKINNAIIKFVKADILADLPQLPQFDIIVSNPPYVLDKEKAWMQKNVLEYEPHRALFVPDHNPLLFYKRIIALTENLLKKGGKLYLEINENFGDEMKNLMKLQGFLKVKVIKDMQGKDRIISSGVRS